MLRRNFIRVLGMSLVSLPGLNFMSRGPISPIAPKESSLWIHGSPYLGHSDFKRNFRGLSPAEIKHQITHFRTDEPWRRAILFEL